MITGSTLTLKVVSGPSIGTVFTKTPGQPLTIGRVPTNNLVLNDPEVSGKHASIKWNSKVNLDLTFLHFIFQT